MKHSIFHGLFSQRLNAGRFDDSKLMNGRSIDQSIHLESYTPPVPPHKDLQIHGGTEVGEETQDMSL